MIKEVVSFLITVMYCNLLAKLFSCSKKICSIPVTGTAEELITFLLTVICMWHFSLLYKFTSPFDILPFHLWNFFSPLQNCRFLKRELSLNLFLWHHMNETKLMLCRLSIIFIFTATITHYLTSKYKWTVILMIDFVKIPWLH